MLTLKAAKALIAFAAAFLSVLGVQMDDGFQWNDMIEAAVAGLAAWQATYWVPNKA